MLEGGGYGSGYIEGLGIGEGGNGCMTGRAEDGMGVGEVDGTTDGARDAEGVGDEEVATTGGAEDDGESKAVHSVDAVTFSLVWLEDFEFLDFKASSVSTMFWTRRT